MMRDTCYSVARCIVREMSWLWKAMGCKSIMSEELDAHVVHVADLQTGTRSFR